MSAAVHSHGLSEAPSELGQIRPKGERLLPLQLSDLESNLQTPLSRAMGFSGQPPLELLLVPAQSADDLVQLVA